MNRLEHAIGVLSPRRAAARADRRVRATFHRTYWCCPCGAIVLRDDPAGRCAHCGRRVPA